MLDVSNQTIKLMSTYTDANGENVSISIEFDGTYKTYDYFCERYLDFLRAIGYHYLESIEVKRQGEKYD